VLIDLRSVEHDTEYACDLCIVGAGPAGIAIADRLRGTPLSIVLLESGGFDPEVPTQRLFRGDIVGRPYFPLDACRYRVFGGSTNRWGGWCRPLDPTDFAHREWLPWSGWPITCDALQPYVADAARLFELSDACFDLDPWRQRLPAPFALDGGDFENALIHYSPRTNFGQAYRARLCAAPNITTLLHANLTGMELDPTTSRVGRLQIKTLQGKRVTVRPNAVVLAAGAIENARLLLASQRDRAAGLGNEHDLVGRFFMEHLHVPAGHILAAPATRRAFYRRARYGSLVVRGVITPTAAARDRHRLLAASIAVEPASYSFGAPCLSWPPPITFGPINLYRKLRAGRWRAVCGTIKSNAGRASEIPTRLRTWQKARAARAGAAGPIFSLYFRSEQAPDPASRVRLSGSRDALGVPQTQLDWRLSAVDITSIAGWLEALERELRARGLGQVIAPPDDWRSGIIGGPHHMGTTRMSADPRAGVVDERYRVHSVDNLYVAGSSVFATGGYANPTFTLVALALRLADTLRDQLVRPYSVQSTS
jgi:choline dehydrogenase-like flavoprotein